MSGRCYLQNPGFLRVGIASKEATQQKDEQQEEGWARTYVHCSHVAVRDSEIRATGTSLGIDTE